MRTAPTLISVNRFSFRIRKSMGRAGARPTVKSARGCVAVPEGRVLPSELIGPEVGVVGKLIDHPLGSVVSDSVGGGRTQGIQRQLRSVVSRELSTGSWDQGGTVDIQPNLGTIVGHELRSRSAD